MNDWRSGHHGADRKVHLFVYHMGESRKRAACFARVNPATYGRRASPALRDKCYDCLAYAAAVSKY